MAFRLAFLVTLGIERPPRLEKFLGQTRYTLRDGFKLQPQLAPLASESFHLRGCAGHLRLQPLRFTIHSGQAFFDLRDLVAQIGRCGDGFKNCAPRLFLLTFHLRQGSGCGRSLLLALRQFVLRRGKIVGRRAENLTVGIAFGFERRQPLLRLRQFSLRRGDSHDQFGAAFLIVLPLGVGAIGLELQLAQPLAILANLDLNGVTALRAFGHARLRTVERYPLVAASPARWC